MSVIYLYGFVPPDAPLPESGLLGVGGAEVERVPYDGFAAVIGRVDEAGYGEAAVERQGSDMEWMAEQGLRHEQVVAWFVDHSVILPSRLLTLFSSLDALGQSVGRGAGRIRADLERFADVREWDLKVAFDAATLDRHLGEASDEIGRLDREIEDAAPGRAFLLRKKRTDLARSEGRNVAVRLANGLLADLAVMARDTARLSPTTEQAPVVLNAALLIQRDREGDAAELARRETDRLAGLGLLVRYTGPWAPYRFIEVVDG